MNSLKLIRIFLIASTIFSLLGAVAFVAAIGSITGQILDEKTGDPLFGANVVIKNTDTGAATDLDGNYRLGNIAAGTYTLSESVQSGYYNPVYTESGITVDTGGICGEPL